MFPAQVGPGEGKEDDFPKIWFDARKIGILCIKKITFTEIGPKCFTFLSPYLEKHRVKTSEKDLGNMHCLSLASRTGSHAPHIKDSRVKLKGKSTEQLKLTNLKYAKGFLTMGYHFSLTYRSAFR